MRSTLIVSVIINLTTLSGCSDRNDRIGFLELRIKTGELRIPYYKDSQREPCHRSCPRVTYQLINNYGQDLMLYNFRRNSHLAYFETELHCDSMRSEQGKTLYLLDNDGTFQPSSMDLHDSTTESFQAMERQFRMGSVWFRNSRVVVKAGDSLEFTENVDFRHYGLQPGTYYLTAQYLQFSTASDLSATELQADLGDATLFRGCLRSDRVKLIVE